MSKYSEVAAISGGKPVYISESGWPSGGNPVGAAIPNPENAASYFLSFISWARANDVEAFYFSAFDETWKVAEGTVGPHWGVFDKEGILKPGMDAVFEDTTVSDHWSYVSGPGNATIELTHVPVIDSTEDLVGRVGHVGPCDYRVAVLIKVNGGWWTKPTYASALTSMGYDGVWVTDITTGGMDASATEIAAFLVPVGYVPPDHNNAPSINPDLIANSVASVSVVRTP
jgi:hypothetical protein